MPGVLTGRHRDRSLSLALQAMESAGEPDTFHPQTQHMGREWPRGKVEGGLAGG